MADWGNHILYSYRISDFVPFSADVYLRLLERVNIAYWPLHLLTLGLGLCALALALRGKLRYAAPMLAILWASTAYGFLQNYYANLNWAGIWFARLFYVEALGLVLLMPFAYRQSGAPVPVVWWGLLLSCLGLIWPLLSLAGRENILELEFAGIHPDPTAVLTVGILMLSLRGWWLLILLPLPLLWCLTSGLTLAAWGLPQAWILLATVAVSILLTAWTGISPRLPRQ